MTARQRFGRVIAAAVLLTFGACMAASPGDSATPESAEPLHEAMDALTTTMVYDIFSPPQASRVYAYASIAAYEGIRRSDTTWKSLAGQVRGMPMPPQPAPNVAYSWPLVGVRALLTVGHALTFSRERMDSIREAMSERYRRTLDADEYARSIAYGDTVARHVLAWADADGFKESRGMPKYSITRTLGRWVPTPPAYMDAIEPHWGTAIKPFAMDSGSQFRPVAAVPFDSSKGSPFYQTALEVYEATRSLTDDERAIAAFWDCNPYVMNVQGHTMFATKKITPGGHWMGIVMTAARQANATPLVAADAYARTAMALADGFIASWEEKFRSGVIRPETVINQYIDEKWTPLLQTPPFPEYPSGHSVISTAAAEVLTEIFGPSFAFTDSTEVPYGLPARSFPSFEAAANQAAISRLYGGIHFRPAIVEGQKQGKQVGRHVVERVVTRPRSALAAQ